SQLLEMLESGKGSAYRVRFPHSYTSLCRFWDEKGNLWPRQFYGVRKNNFKTADSQGTVEKAAEEAELGLGGQVEHRNGDGDVQELGRRIAAGYRRSLARIPDRIRLISEPGQQARDGSQCGRSVDSLLRHRLHECRAIRDRIEECAAFPNAAHDDMVDAWSQVARRFRNSLPGIFEYC